MRYAAILLTFLIAAQAISHESADMQELEARLDKMERQLSELQEKQGSLEDKSSVLTKAVNIQSDAAYPRAQAIRRINKDDETYSASDVEEIEELYQSGEGRWMTSDGRAVLKKLQSRYPKSNRTGCAVLSTAEVSRGSDKEDYLKQAISSYSGCYYGNGVQVGPYAKYLLADYYRLKGDDKKARALYIEVRDKHPESVDHQGRLLAHTISKRL